MPKHSKQHTIPRSYLASWIDPVTPTGQTGAIWRISKDRLEKWRRSPVNTFTETDRYTIRMKDGTRNLFVENTLGQTESDFQPILTAIRRRENLTALQRAKLAIFTAAMMGRSKKQGDHWLAQWKDYVEKIKRMEGRLARTGERPLSEQLEQSLENSHANLVIDTIRAAAPVLLSMTLTIVTTNDTDGFITSDAPAVMYNPSSYKFPPFFRSPGLLQTDVEVSMPLSPHALALYCRKPLHLLYTPIPDKYVDEFNRTTYFFADEEFISWKGHTREIWFEKREPPPDAWKNTNGETKHPGDSETADTQNRQERMECPEG
jgi:putative sterol carrier protein